MNLIRKNATLQKMQHVERKLLFSVLNIFVFFVFNPNAIAQGPKFSWVDRIGAAGYTIANSICSDKSGNIYIAGKFRGNPDFDPSNLNEVSLQSKGNNDDIFIAKYSSVGDLVWVQEIADSGDNQALSLCLDASNNVFIGGLFSKTADFDPGAGVSKLIAKSKNDVFILKLNTSGTFIWAKQFEGNKNAYSPTLTLDKWGNIIVSGSFEGIVDFDPSSGSFNLNASKGMNVFIAKLNASGSFVWSKQLKGNGSSYGNAIKADGIGSIYLSGVFSDTVDFDPGANAAFKNSAGLRDIFLLKLDSSGRFRWVNSFDGKGDENKSIIEVDKNANVFLVGNYTDVLDLSTNASYLPSKSNGLNDFIFTKFDSTGSQYWCHSIGGLENDEINDLKVDTLGNVFAVGFFMNVVDFNPSVSLKFNLTSGGNFNSFIIKLSTIGAFLFAKSFYCNYKSNTKALVIEQSGNVILASNFSGTVDTDFGIGLTELKSKSGSDLLLVKIDLSANLTWYKRMGNWQDITGAAVASDLAGNVYTTGYFMDVTDFDPSDKEVIFTSNGGSDVFISKHSNLGELIWVRTIGGIGYDGGHDISVDDSGNVYVAGDFRTTIDFDPGIGVYNVASLGGQDMFLCKFNSAGNFVWAFGLGDFSVEDEGLSVCVDVNGDICMTGKFQGSVDFNPGVGTNKLSSPSGFHNTFIAKYNSKGQFVFVKQIYGDDNRAISIKTDMNGSIYLTGYCNGTADFDPGFNVYNLSLNNKLSYLLKLDGNGKFKFAEKLGFETMTPDALAIDSKGAIYTAGQFYDSVDVDPGANVYKMYSSNMADMIVLKVDSLGMFKWARSFGSKGGIDDLIFAIGVDKTDNLYTTGFFSDAVDFDPGVNVYKLSTAWDNHQAFIHKMDSLGNFVWVAGMPGIHEQISAAISINPSNVVHTTGNFEWYTDFDPGIKKYAMIPSADNDGYILKLIQCSNSSSNITAKSCDNYKIGNHVYTKSGTFYDTIQNYMGCDSFVKLNLTMRFSAKLTSRVDSIFAGDSFFFGNKWLNKGGSYYDTLKTKFGCDSVVYLNLSIRLNRFQKVDITTCQDSSFYFNNKLLLKSGIYYDTLKTYQGYDSIIMLNIVFKQKSSTLEKKKICEGSSILFNNNRLTQTGLYRDTLMSANGCDSIVNLELSVLKKSKYAFAQRICLGMDYRFNSRNCFAEGKYTDTLVNYQGCDSIVILALYVDTIEVNVTRFSNILTASTQSKNGMTYQWVKCDSAYLLVKGATSKDFTPTTKGTYSVIVSNGICQDTSSCVEMNDISSVKSLPFFNRLIVYPNPSGGIFKLSATKPLAIKIYNIYGGLLLETTVDGESEIDLTDKASGVYYIISVDNLIQPVKIIIE